MANKYDPAIAAVLIAKLRHLSAQVVRIDRQGNQTPICMATRLGKGLWLTVRDRGLYGEGHNGEVAGTLQVIDAWLKMPDDQLYPIEWCHQTAIKPITICYVPGTVQDEKVKIGSSALMYTQDYGKLYRIDGQLYDGVHEISIYDRPWPMRYDSRDENRIAICGRGDTGYRTPKHVYGEPIINGNGDLLAVHIGSDWGTDSSHAGFFVYVDHLAPCLQMAMVMQERKAKGESHWRVSIDAVEHRSNDVYFD